MPSQPRQSRLFRFVELAAKKDSGEGWEHPPIPTIVPEAEANLIGSLTDTGEHMPVLDIDRIPVRVVESTTPGNYHLYIDKPMPWWQYQDLLRALAAAGILETGWVDACIKQGATFVRKPGVKK